MVFKSQVGPSMVRDTNSKKIFRNTPNVWEMERAMGFQVGDLVGRHTDFQLKTQL